MPPPSRRSFGGAGAYQKKRKSGPRPKTSGPKASREKRGRAPRQKKQKKDTLRAPTPPSDVMPANTAVGPDLVSEEASLQVRLASTKALHARWKSEDTMLPIEGEALIARRRERCKDIRLTVFSFTLQEAQVDAIYKFFYERRDLLLLAKTGFGKSLIFQLLPFLFDPTGVVIILMPLKLLQAEQNR